MKNYEGKHNAHVKNKQIENKEASKQTKINPEIYGLVSLTSVPGQSRSESSASTFLGT